MERREYKITTQGLRVENEDFTSFMVTGDTKSQRPIPKFLKGQIHYQADLWGQESAHDPSMETFLQILEPVTDEPPQDSINRFADLLVNLQNKPRR